MSEIELNFSVQLIQANFEGLLGGGKVGNFINEMLSDIGPQLIDAMWPDIAPTVESTIKDVCDNIHSRNYQIIKFNFFSDD